MTRAAGDIQRPALELAVLLASAGGLDALSVVLRDLPTEFSAAVVIQQHLGGPTSVLPTILGRQTPRRVSWAQDGQAVVPGEVVVCPPGTHLELMPDGRCRLRRMEALGERRFDVLLASVATSYGARSVAVMLSGSGHDGAIGTAAMKRAGAVVIAQSPETALYTSLPLAAVRAGADLVLPIHDIGRVLAALVAGGAPPQPIEGARAMPLGPRERAAAWESDATTAEGGSMDSHTAGGAGTNRQLPDHLPNSAAARAEMARQRATELRRRRQDLSAGFGATEQTAAVARRRAEESVRRAQLAHQAASEATARWGH
ncbi:hypothetical protein BST11_05745 [Mycobacterium alsense]|uniref:protein-glutamate methylesterase n=1 Tax=Mycobacterium alsense TaxID=324058 RepID=A0AA41XNA1_9MYCO|nr:chemotaxis protein CheB [Mycobacterium alsense]MCV7379251.1 chemotaxis protein CheB [Mycobacterium alsense]OQZ92428.1 hypothetical protein BST11_05745 [Mycobacterium alsense]